VATIGFLVMTAAFGLNFAAGQFFVPLGREEGWAVAELSAAAALRVITAALALLAGSYLLLAVVSELWQLFLVYGLLAGIGFGSASSMAVSVLISHWYVRRRASVLARTFMGINAGQLTLLPLGGVLIVHAGTRTAYLVLGLLVMLVVVPAAAVGLGEALRSRDWWLLTLAFGLNGATLYLTLLHLPRLAVDVGGTAATGGALIATAAAASAASMLAHGALATRVDKRWLIGELFVLRAGALAVAAGADSVATPPAATPPPSSPRSAPGSPERPSSRASAPIRPRRHGARPHTTSP
jgi:MFS family permease